MAMATSYIPFLLIVIPMWIILLFIVWHSTFDSDRALRRNVIIILSVLSILAAMGFNWFLNSTATGMRFVKTNESNFNNGIERVVKVYSVDGQMVQYYRGRFDIQYDHDRILFDDENGYRHIIYYLTGTVIIDEVDPDFVE